jgi:hypothetical protein
MAAVLACLLLVSAAIAGRGGTDRPFRATLAGSVHWTFPGTSPSNCTRVTTHGAATGEATHLGRVVVSWSHCPDEPNYLVDGRMTITAANGDTLNGTYNYDPNSTSNSIPTTITGGTGRFAGATGTVVVTYSVNPVFWPMPPCNPDTSVPPGCLNVTVPWSASWSITGTISY